MSKNIIAAGIVAGALSLCFVFLLPSVNKQGESLINDNVEALAEFEVPSTFFNCLFNPDWQCTMMNASDPEQDEVREYAAQWQY